MDKTNLYILNTAAGDITKFPKSVDPGIKDPGYYYQEDKIFLSESRNPIDFWVIASNIVELVKWQFNINEK